MKVGKLRSATATALTVVIGVTGLAQPAAAAESGNTAGDVEAQAVAFFDWTGLTIAVAGLLFGGGGSSDAALQAAVQEIKVAIEASEANIIGQIDAIAAADVRACAEANTIEFSDIDLMPPPVLFSWAQNATGCATLASAYANAVQSPQAADTIAAIIEEIFAIVLAARGAAGLTNGTDLVLQSEMNAFQGVIATLEPECWQTTEPHPVGYPYYIRRYWCQRYNSPTAVTDDEEWNYSVRISEPVDQFGLKRSASFGTNWWDAYKSLERLQAAFPQLA